MARSLTVQQEESPRASMLFLTFVGLCAGLLMLTWFSGPVEASDVPADEAAAVAKP